MPQLWWQDAVFYQIGDGIGDLDGITAHLDHLNGAPHSLGIDAIWLSPINPSPNRDWGYDVTDYCGIHPDLGDFAAFDRLIAEAHRRGIRVILDLVPNHTSDQHEWFLESRSSRANPKRDWYIWRPGRDGGPPNNWLSTFGGSAWQFDERTGEWYLHSFLPTQPDLNYRNPAVVGAMEEVIRFWLARGADGFRVDVISYLVKDAGLRDNPARTDRDPPSRLPQVPLYSQDQPEAHDIIRGFRRVIDSFGARVLVGEVWPREQRSLRDYLRTDECNLAFNFAFLFRRWEAAAFRKAVAETEALLGSNAWPTYTLSNHDFPRHITRYAAGDTADARARVAAMMLLGLRGTPFLYFGEEIGMTNVEVAREHRRDPVGRDGCRTPMQWSAAPHGGFTSGAETWLPCGDCTRLNVESQSRDPQSLLSFYRQMIALRRATPALREGRYRGVADAPEDCFVFVRETGEQRVLIALNFSASPRAVRVALGRLLLSTRVDRRGEKTQRVLSLAPNEGAIVALL